MTDPTGTDAARPVTVFIPSRGAAGEDPTRTDAAPPATRLAASAAAGTDADLRAERAGEPDVTPPAPLAGGQPA